MRRASVITALSCLVVALATGPTLADVTIFLSDMTTVTNGVPDIDTTSADSGSLGIYVLTGAGDEAILNGLSLNATSSDATFTFDVSSQVFNPAVTAGTRWFEDTVNGYNIETKTDLALTNIIGVALDAGQGSGEPGEGLGAAGDVADLGTGAYLFAQIDYSWLANATGTLDLTVSTNGVIDSADAVVGTVNITGATYSPDGPVFDPKDANHDGMFDPGDGSAQKDIDDIFLNFGAPTLGYDTDSSGVVDADDVVFLVTEPMPNGWDTNRGDANLDGFVDGLDATALALRFGVPGDWGWKTGDFNGTQGGVDEVDGVDATILALNWSPPPAAASSVPEPTSFVLLLSGLLLFWRLR